MSKIVNTAARCTVKMFVSCMFDNNLNVLGKGTLEELKEAWNSIHIEYIDLSESQLNQEVALLKTISALDSRIRTITLATSLQQLSMQSLGKPHELSFEFFRRYGHKIMWDNNKPDVDGFFKRLKDINTREARYKTELEIKINQLFEVQKKKMDGKMPEQEHTRAAFYSLLNSLEKFGFKIDEEKTTVERLAIMIKDYTDFQKKEAERARNSGRKRG